VLRRLGRERPADVPAHERLIRFLHDAGRPADALATALDLLRTYGEDDSIQVARVRCAAARQLDAMGRHEDALTMIERALPTEAVCAYRWRRCSSPISTGRKMPKASCSLTSPAIRRPRTAADVAEVRWRIHDDAGAADILAHPPASLTRRDFREIGERFADVFAAALRPR